jgi:hypothetical protein
MSFRVSEREALKRGWIKSPVRRVKGISSKIANTGNGTPQKKLYARFKKRYPGIPLEWEKKKLISGRRFETDLFIPPKLVIEVDGFQFHRSKQSFQTDRIRQNLFASHGFIVLRYFTKQIHNESELGKVIDQIFKVHTEINHCEKPE